jgi:hypothetical protein
MEIFYNGQPFDIKKHFDDCGKSKNTCYTYISMIRKVLKLMETNQLDVLIDRPNEVIDVLKALPNNNSAKTILSAIVVLLDGIGDKDTANIYREIMMSKIKKHEEEQLEQTMSEKQAKNWMSWDEILYTYEKTAKIAKSLLSSGDKFNSKELQIIQNWVIMSLYTKIPPRRILDYVLLRWEPSEDGKDTDNYVDLKRKKLIFNIYKTAKTYGAEEVDIPKDLMIVLKKWQSIKPEGQDYVLFNSLGRELGQSELTVKLNKIFDKNISASMLRHIYLSDLYKNIPALKKMKETAKDMGHSLDQALKYVKKI